MICQVEAKESLKAGRKTSQRNCNHTTLICQSFPYHSQLLGHARGFGYAVSGALLIQVYGIFFDTIQV